jgi:winged helix DNA-binding protein
VRARRLARGFLAERASTDRFVDVVRVVCGVHAQVQASAELQLAARVENLTQADVRNALWQTRTLVKAWTLRGTLHLHPADELALWFAARRAVFAEASELPAWTDPQRVVHPPVSANEAAELRRAVWDAFGGRALLRDELATEVVNRVGNKHEGRLRSGFAFFLSEVCQGPPQGTKITLARPDQWIEGWHEVNEQDALREVVRRFLYAYGPSRPGEFREWFGAEVTFGLVDLDEVDVEGKQAFVLAGDTDFPEPKEVLRLLPEYDVYVMGFRERDALVPERVREQVASHGRGRYEGPAGVRFLLVDGLAAGLWERKKRGKRIELRVSPARKLTRVQRSRLEAEAQRIGAFLDLEPELSVE